MWRAVLTIIVLAAVYTVIAGVLMRAVEPETYTDLGDALWWAIATVSTTGYGDLVPVTEAGRAVASVTMLVGMAFVPLVTTVVVSTLMRRAESGQLPVQERRWGPPDPGSPP